MDKGKNQKRQLERKFCMGISPLFANKRCDHYVSFESSNTLENMLAPHISGGLGPEELVAHAGCHLIMQRKTMDLFESKRCNLPKIVTVAVKNILQKHRYALRHLDQKELRYTEDRFVETIILKLQNRQLTRNISLDSFVSYIGRTAFTEAQDFFREEGVYIRRQCGKCIYLSKTKPNKCLKKNIEKKASQASCKEEFTTTKLIPFEPVIRQKRKYGLIESEYEEKLIKHITLKEHLKSLEVIERWLNDRIQLGKTEHKKITYERQYKAFSNFRSMLISEGISINATISKVATKLGVSEKIIKRDFVAIQKFLVDKMSPDFLTFWGAIIKSRNIYLNHLLMDR